MKEMKDKIEYRIEWIKKEIKNNVPLLQDQDKIVFVNAQLGVIYDLALVAGKEGICKNIINYREIQSEIEERIHAESEKLLKNMDNIIKNILMEL
jgi:excinuclease UvrABC helicase subunit UvrB